MPKTDIISLKVFEKLKFKKSCNLIGKEHLGLQLENQNYLRRAVFTK